MGSQRGGVHKFGLIMEIVRLRSGGDHREEVGCGSVQNGRNIPSGGRNIRSEGIFCIISGKILLKRITLDAGTVVYGGGMIDA
jgi:hypothetical protein